jgi:hypothetical protein
LWVPNLDLNEALKSRMYSKLKDSIICSICITVLCNLRRYLSSIAYDCISSYFTKFHTIPSNLSQFVPEHTLDLLSSKSWYYIFWFDGINIKTKISLALVPNSLIFQAIKVFWKIKGTRTKSPRNFGLTTLRWKSVASRFIWKKI